VTINDSLNLIRQHLTTAKGLSQQSGAAFAQVEEDGDAASAIVSGFSGEVYQASNDDESTNSAQAGMGAARGLDVLGGQHEAVGEDLGTVKSLEPQLVEALRAAQDASYTLGIPDVDSWFVRNALDSALREGEYAEDSSDEIADSLRDAGYEFDLARRSAGAVAGDQDGIDVSFEGERLYQSVENIDDAYQQVGKSAGHGQQQQDQVGYFVDQALQAVDALQSEFVQSAPVERPAPATAEPLPGTITDWLPPDSTAPLSVSQPVQASSTPDLGQGDNSPAPQPDGFFLKPWQG
jgi:hypothetical protein